MCKIYKKRKMQDGKIHKKGFEKDRKIELILCILYRRIFYDFVGSAQQKG